MKSFKLSFTKILSLFLAILTVLLLCACNSNDTKASDEKVTGAPSATENDATSGTSAPTDANTSTDTPTDAPTSSEEPTDSDDEYGDGKLRIFADGKYKCKIIRPENASSREIELYVNLREMLKEITGVMPPIATDFIAYNESYDPNEFAILVGQTKHDEAAELYSKLTYSDFRAELVNKKYVLGFHDMDTANSALNKIKSLLLNNFKNGEIILDSTWNYTLSEKELLEDIPIYDGGKFSDVYEGAYGMQTIVVEKTSADDYSKYLSKLSDEGFTFYTDNSIGENLFATYTSDKYILTAMYFDPIKEVRVTLERAGNYALPALESENIYTETGAVSSITQIGLEESAGIQNGMSYVIKLADGSFMVFDGGTGRANLQFVEVMQSLADDPDHITIAAWVVTHAHGDHMGLILNVLFDKRFAGIFDVEQIIWSKVSDKQMANMDGGSMDYIDNMFATLKDTKIVIAHPGQAFYIRNAVYTVLATIEMVEPITLANLNDSSVVGRLEIDGKTIMFPGDSHPTETAAITAAYAHELKSDAVQVIHHGYQGGDAVFYSMVDPLIVFWPLGMKNYSTAEAPNTPMKDWSYSAWLFSEDSKVQNIYVAGSSVVTIPIAELPSHSDT